MDDIDYIQPFMSAKITHKAQAEHNEKLALQLSNSDSFDWSITCAFYAALHYVEAKFATLPKILHTEECFNRNKDFANEAKITNVHSFREWLISKNFSKTVYGCYKQLQRNSEIARYLEDARNKTAFTYFTKEIVKKLLDNLNTIKNELS